MILIIGGAYQGKLDYALERFTLQQSDVFYCNSANTSVDFSKPIIYCFHQLAAALLQEGSSPKAWAAENLWALQDKIIISDDISCGVVPMAPDERRLREEVGHMLAYLSRSADEVARVFCGIGTCIKGDKL